jgi:hypothetical protein
VLPSREPVFDCLPLEICGRSDKLGSINVVERVDVEDSVAAALDCACYDRHRSAGQADVEICRLCSEPISGEAGLICDPQTEPCLGV